MNWFNRSKKKRHALEKKGAINPIKKLLAKNIISYKQFSTITSVLESGELCARDIMLPRVDVVAIDINATPKQLIKFVLQATHSRFPVYNSNIDDIKGIIHIKDFFSLIYDKKEKQKDPQIKNHLTQPFFIPESREIFDVLKDFQQKRQQMAVVVDEYGGFSGIVTMEDILEEIIGDIKDESDIELESVIKVSENKFSIDARADLETINEITGLHLESQKAETLGGFIINLLGYVPKLGEIISQDNLDFKIKHKRGNSLIRIILKIKVADPTESPSPSEHKNKRAQRTKKSQKSQKSPRAQKSQKE